MLLRTTPDGKILQGQVVHLETSSIAGGSFSGNIQLSALSRRQLLRSTITNGFIDELHKKTQTGNHISVDNSKTVTLVPASGGDWLPEVIVVGYTSGGSPDTYISLDGLLGAYSSDPLGGGGSDASSGGGSGGSSGGGSSSGSSNGPDAAPVYTPADPGAHTTTPTRGSGLTVAPALEVEPEYINLIPTVDVKKLFNCFDQVSNDGAIYSIQLCADVPSNSNPDASMNFSGGVSAGHAFLVVSKSSNGVTITQSFGYYPQTDPSPWNPFSPLPSAIKDNKGQEINASISMTVNAEQFNSIRTTAINLSSNPYVLDKSNCTDYALSVFNAGRSIPLTMDPYYLRQAGIVMGNGMSSTPITVTINNSPQKLYAKLSTMKKNGDIEAQNILLDLSHNLKAPISHGECN